MLVRRRSSFEVEDGGKKFCRLGVRSWGVNDKKVFDVVYVIE